MRMISPSGRRRAGFELAVAHDLFVHHFGSRTFLGNGIDINGLLKENATRFAAKWGLVEGDNGRERVLIKPWRRPAETVDAQRDRGDIEVGQAFQPDTLCTLERRQAGKPDLRSAASSQGRPGTLAAAYSNDEPGQLRAAWEGEFNALHSLAMVNRAVCRGLIERGHDVRLIASSAGTSVEPDERLELDARLRQRRLAVAGTGAARDD